MLRGSEAAPQSRNPNEASIAGVVRTGLGFDSCGIFYIGGCVEVSTPWNLSHMDVLSAVADADAAIADVLPLDEETTMRF